MSRRVLVVDDDASMREMLEADLREAGFDVATRGAAAEALELVSSQELDAVVTDLNMKGMGGVELCERIAKSRPDLPVVVITAFGSLQTAVDAMRAGAYDFVTKPFD